jgi:hypothetical protein
MNLLDMASTEYRILARACPANDQTPQTSPAGVIVTPNGSVASRASYPGRS